MFKFDAVVDRYLELALLVLLAYVAVFAAVVLLRWTVRSVAAAWAVGRSQDADAVAEQWRLQALAAMAERDRALAELAELRSDAVAPDGAPTVHGGSSEPRFRAAKKAFARLFHPDNLRTDGLERALRTEIFKEFWQELEAIERRGQG